MIVCRSVVFSFFTVSSPPSEDQACKCFTLFTFFASTIISLTLRHFRCRFLRNRDRVQNNQTYPCLNYPEMYLLEGGYKDFYTHYSVCLRNTFCAVSLKLTLSFGFFQTLCQPMSYLPMHAKEHENELRKFRSIVKSHSFDTKFTTHKRNTFRH